MVENNWQWLQSTEKLQTETYRYDFDSLNLHQDQLAKYIQWNLFAIYQELAETAVEFSWKPWATDEPFVNRNRVRDELIDACHFIGNILVALGITDQEWEANYRNKQELNRKRAESGRYSAKKGGLGEGSEV